MTRTVYDVCMREHPWPQAILILNRYPFDSADTAEGWAYYILGLSKDEYWIEGRERRRNETVVYANPQWTCCDHMMYGEGKL